MIQAEILGRLLLMQNIIINLPMHESVFSFACRGLQDMPGVAEASFSIHSRSEKQENNCIYFGVGKGDNVFGEIRVKISDMEAFAPYENYIRNFIFMIEIVLKERQQRFVNQQQQAELEKRVAERTRRLSNEIKERKQVEQSLQQSINLLRIAGEKAKLGGWFIHLKEGRVFWTDEVAAIHEVPAGYSPLLEEGLAFYAPEWQNKISQVFADCVQYGVNYDEEMEVITFRGKRLWVRTIGEAVRDDQGKIIGVQGAFQDISEQKLHEEKLRQSEEKYRTFIETMQDGVYRSCGSRFREVNRALVNMLGYSHKEELLSVKMSNIIHPDDVDTVQQATHMDTGLMVYRMLRKNGSEMWVQDHSRQVLDEEGRFLFREGTIRDITQQRKAEEVQRQVELARESVKIKQNFLANMSHEIRTPLTGILGMIEVLGKTSLTKQQLDYINTLRLSGENLKEIINQVLDFSKIEAGKAIIKPVVFDPRAMICDAELLYKTIIKDKVKLKAYIDPRIPDFIKADKNRIFQIVNNLLSNALKFTHKGTVFIKLKPVRLNDKDILIRVEVRDSGIGIPDEMQKKLFVPFFQIENNDVRDYEGTGLGLSICKELVILLGGEIGFESQLEKGSTFWFTFPAFVATEPMLVESEKRPFNSDGKLRILFAEDKAINQKVIKLMLEELGHEVTIASNGEHALELYEHGKFDLILMDIQMPVMDGITATQELKTRYHNLPPVFGLSANAFEGDREKYMALGMDEYLTKPLRMEDFNQLVFQYFPVLASNQ
jgi:PAS domain S-box-containing protein